MLSTLLLTCISTRRAHNSHHITMYLSPGFLDLPTALQYIYLLERFWLECWLNAYANLDLKPPLPPPSARRALLGSKRVLKRLEKVVKFTDFLNKRNLLSFCGPLKSPNGFLWKKTTTTSSAFALATLLASKIF